MATVFVLWKFFMIVILFIYYGNCSIDEEIKLQILGIFGTGSEIQGRAFTECMNSANGRNIKLTPTTIKPYRNDSYSTLRTLCSKSEEMDIRPVAIVGPQDHISDSAIKDQCAQMHIPHLQATWQPLEPDDEMEEEPEDTENELTEENDSEELLNKRITLNFYPNSDEISLAYAHLLQYYNWESFAVLYEDDYGLRRVQKILSEHTGKFPITVRRLDPTGENKHIFKDIKTNQESRVLLDCNIDNALKYIQEASELKMMNEYQHYILTSLDTNIIVKNIERVSSNVSWLSITNYDRLEDSQHFLSSRVGNWISDANEVKDSPPVIKMKLESLLMDDIASHLINALSTIDPEKLREYQPPKSCEDSSEPWSLGSQFLHNLMTNETQGVTGNILFDETGRRINYTLHVNEIYTNERHIVGRWESATLGPIIEMRPVTQIKQQNSKHFTIISRLALPYLSYINETTKEYEGFSKELADEIFKILNEMGYNYTYSFANNLDHLGYGKLDPNTKQWDGLIGELLNKEADLAICDLTITEQRKKVVDFSVPFMTLGISILYRKEHEIPPDTFSFLHPYSFEVWMHTATAYCVVSIIMFVCSRISPADWENPQPCDKDPEELENIWNFKNCTWLTMGSIMTQGCDILPKAVGSRWVCAMWWFFALIVCQTYIAQLAASLTSALEEEPINNVEDLAKQNKILYGVLNGGSSYNFFKNSKDKMYLRMFDNMQANPVVFVNSNKEGVQFVLKSKNGFAFFMESSSIEYELQRNCDLQKVGGELDSKDYGIAMPANSPFRSQINMAILRLKELTRLDNITKTWWSKGKTECVEEEKKGDVEGDLEMKNLIGAFLVLIIGLVLCLVITAFEFMNEVRNIVLREQVTHKEAFIKELKASLDFKQNQKPVLRNPSRAPSVAMSLKSVGERQATRAAALADFINFEKFEQ